MILWTLPIGIALVVSTLTVPLIMIAAERRGWHDYADERKTHVGQVPRLGGVAIFAGTAIAIGIIATTSDRGVISTKGSWQLPVGLVTMFLVGLLDDFRNTSPIVKIGGQLVAAILIVLGGATIGLAPNPGASAIRWIDVFSAVGSVLWIVFMANALNLVDGMDGLASTIAIIAAVFFAVLHLLAGNPDIAVAALAVAGAVGGFLFFNFPPARIFMGDCGSLFLGTVFATMPLVGHDTELSWKLPTLVIGSLVLLVPIADSVTAIIRRTRARRPFWHGDRGHIHHKLLDAGYSSRRSLAIVAAVATAEGGVAIVIQYIPDAGVVPLLLLVLAVHISLIITIYRGDALPTTKQKSTRSEEKCLRSREQLASIVPDSKYRRSE